jgi:hypothetical protein
VDGHFTETRHIDRLVVTFQDETGEPCPPTLTGTQRLALCSVLTLALALLLAPPLAATLSMVNSTALDHVLARLEVVSRVAFLAQVGRLPLSLVLATWLARSSRES